MLVLNQPCILYSTLVLKSTVTQKLCTFYISFLICYLVSLKFNTDAASFFTTVGWLSALTEKCIWSSCLHPPEKKSCWRPWCPQVYVKPFSSHNQTSSSTTRRKKYEEEQQRQEVSCKLLSLDVTWLKYRHELK